MRVKGDNDRARKLRRSMTLPEVLLWRELKKRPNGVQYHRQHPAGPYVLDFFCAPANLPIEVDGEAHDRRKGPQKDAARDAWLKSQGIRVMRFPANDVLKNLNGVLQFIAVATDGR